HGWQLPVPGNARLASAHRRRVNARPVARPRTECMADRGRACYIGSAMRWPMRLSTRDLPLIPLLLPVVAIGLFPLVMLPLLGFLGFVVLGILIGFAAVMAELEEQGAHTTHVISHGRLSRAEHAGYSLEMQK